MGAGTGACWFNWSISSILAMKYELKPPSAITEIHVPGTVPLLPILTLGIPRVHPLLLPACPVMPKEDLNLLWKPFLSWTGCSFLSLPAWWETGTGPSFSSYSPGWELHYKKTRHPIFPVKSHRFGPLRNAQAHSGSQLPGTG